MFRGGGGYVSTPVTVEVEAVPIVVESTTDDYFVLYVLHDLGGRELRIPVLVALGGNGTTTLSENLPALPKERYHLEKYLVSEPADIDGDCIDDIIELENPVGMSPINRNPVNPNSIDLIDGAMTIPDLETFNALSILHPHTGTSNFKFYIVGLDTADPSIFFFNANTHNYHSSFQNAVNIGNLTNWESLGVFFFDPNATAPDGTSGAYVFRLQPYSAYSFEVIDIAYTMLAASMPLVDNNLAYYVPAADVGYYQYDAASYNESRINVLLEDDFVSDNPFVPLNPAEGYGLLRIMDPDERPGPRDVVLYDAIPNEMPRVAGIITTAPQTPLSHVNLRAIQDGIPNAFIRDALDDDSITDLVGNYVHYTVTSSGWEMTVATQAQVNTHHASSRPAHEQILHADLSVTSITPLSEIRFEDWDAFGIKATNLAVLRTLDFTAGTTPDGFAIPFYFYDQFMKHNGFYDRINTMLVDREFQTDLSTQESELKNLRKAIKKGQTPAWITTALEEMHSQFDNNTSIRYRSSTNNEDLPGFNGAGLYDSKTQHPAETVEDGISKSLKQVYASMWNLRAFAERDFHRVNHTSTMMGVLVHPNYSDELANGVAVSFDPATGSTDTYYVNTQIGEDLVTNPEALSVPEEIKLSKTDIAFGIILHIVPGSPDQSYVEQVYRPKYTVLVTSNHMPPGTLLMSNEQMDQLRKYLSTIHDKFADLYEVESGEQFAMEIEFKITSEDSLAIKQARTWVFGNDTDANSPPTVSAGQDHVVVNGDAVSLEGIATDREGNDLTYQWTSDYSGLTIIGGDTLAPTFTAPEVDFETAIIFTLTVSDGTAEVSDQIIITITDSANTAPTVDAGTDQEITEGSTVTLAGTAADADQEDNLTYLWSHDSTLSISLDDSTLTPSFTVPNVSEDTAVEFTLTVSDGTAEVSDQIIITITDSANTAPTVDAGTDQEITEGSTVTLAGTAADVDQEDNLTYLWSHDSTLSISLDDSTLTPSFTVPNVSEDTAVEFTLTVSDGTAEVSDQIIITITDSANTAPTVDAGTDQEITEGSTVTLAGTAADVDQEDNLTYLWSHDSTLSISLDDSTLTPSFTVPNVSEDTAVEFTLTVSDGTAEVSDQIIITITDSANTAPTVDAGADREVLEGSTVTLAGTAADVDQEDNLTYLWSHDSTLSISLDDSTLTPSFTVPNVSEDTAVEFTLTVSDGTAEVSDQIIITITDSANTAPTVDAGADREVLEGSTVTLAGNSTDNDSLTYSWRQTSGLPAVDLQGANTPSPTFTAPAVASDTVFIFEMTVNDGSEILTDTVEITIRDMPDLSYFITTWRTGTAGESITIPVGGATGTYTVDWGDGNTSVNVTGDQTHLYDDAGTYTVHISGDFTRIYLNEDPSNADKLVSIERWGDTRWESMISAFHGASNMVYRATDVPVLSDVTSMRYMFYDAQSFDGDLSGWDVSRVTDMAGTFWGASSFDGDLSGWDVSRVTDMTGTFWGASSFNGDLSGWDVLSVTNMRSMFNGASSFNGDLSGWDVSSVTDMTSMFAGASSFDGDLSGWNVSRVTGMFAMFSAADSFDADLSGWNVSSVTAMSVMFRGASSFDADLSDWDVSSVDAMSVMFMDASSFDADLSDWNVSGVTDMSNMFRGASSFNGDLSDWDVSRVTDMSDMFSGAHSFNADISSWSVSRVTDMYAMFNGAHSFNADISGWDVSRVTDMYAMFYQTNAFDQNLGKWYIVLDDAVIEGDNATGTVGRIAAQNSFLGAQNPSYSIGSGVDSASFEMDGASLRLKAVSDHLTGDSYTINVTSSGGFGTNNFRILEVPVEVSNISPATGTDINQTALAEPAVPLGAPQNLLAVSTDTTVTLTWDSPDDDSITGYKILSRTPATQSQLSVLVDDTGAPGISYVIEGLDPDTVYVFRVIAVNAHGESDSSNFVRLSTDVASTTTDVASTPASAPDAPQNLLAVSTDTTVTLTWDSSDDDSITGYKILSRTPATQSQLSVLVDDTGAPGTSYVIEGLDPDTVYVFRVIAINAHGESDSSNFVRLSTLP